MTTGHHKHNYVGLIILTTTLAINKLATVTNKWKGIYQIISDLEYSSSCNGQLVVWAFIVILLLSSLLLI